MTWLAWSAIALAVLVTVLNAWMTWQRLASASRRPAEPGEEYPSGRRSKGEREAPGVLEELDERGYLSRRRLQMGCEAAICRTPFGARIVAGRNGLEEPLYAWDYTSVDEARKALARIELAMDPEEGTATGEPGSGFYPAAEPHDYLRRWKYTVDGQLQRF